MCKFAILTAAGDPLIGYLYEELDGINLHPTTVLVDQKGWGEKDYSIFQERTGGKLAHKYPDSLDSSIIYYTDDHRSDESINFLKSKNCNVIINGGTPRILTKEFLGNFEITLNCHPGILPKYRGCTAVEWSIFNDDPVGNTVHVMSEGIDEGDIIIAQPVDVVGLNSYVDIRIKVFLSGFSLMANVLLSLLKHGINSIEYTRQKEGNYWMPIDSQHLEGVKKKVMEGKYKYQNKW